MTEIEQRLRMEVGKVWPCGVDVSWDEDAKGFAGTIIEVGREDGRLYADVDYGYRFYVPEDRPVAIADFVDKIPAQSEPDLTTTAEDYGCPPQE